MSLPNIRRFTMATIVLAEILLNAPHLQAGTIRTDTADSLYTSLAQQSDFDSVGEFLWTESDGSYIASGVLINDQWVLTAAHVVSGIDSSNISTMTFTIGGTIYYASETYYNAGWTDDVNDGYDIGLVKLSTVVTTATAATVYTGSDENHTVATIVGYGLTGNGSTGVQSGSYGTKRAGTNVISLGSALNSINWTGGGNDSLLVADFDQPGMTSGDPTTSLGVPTDLEYCAAPGDSGGGWFIEVDGEYQLAGITSFLLSQDNIQCNYDDLFGATRVSDYLDWISQYTSFNVAIPEPASALLLLSTGLMLIRRRRSRVAM